MEQETEGICQPVLRKENLGTTQIVAHIDQNSDVGATHVSHKLQQTILGSLSLLWSLNHVDRSPDPNPCGVELSDTRNFQFYKNATVDQETEAKLDDRS